MWCTKGMEADSLEHLKNQFVDYYDGSFVSERDVGYIVYLHDSGIETNLSDRQIDDFIEQVNEVIYDSRSEFQKEWDVGCDKYHNGREL